MSTLNSYSTRVTPQDRPASSKQVKNAAGGYAFAIDDVSRLRRFLILGSEGTYYVNAKDSTIEHGDLVVSMAETNSRVLVETILDVSLRGAAPKQDRVLFALTIAASHGSDADKAYALEQLPKIARTGTHLMQFVTFIQQFRGWGRGLRRAVGAWYTDKTPEKLAYQVVKYGNREGWTHRDVLRKAHASTEDPTLNAVLAWAARGTFEASLPPVILGYLKLREAGVTENDVIFCVQHCDVSWEMIPSELLSKRVWLTLLDQGMPMTALLRKLPVLTNQGVFQGRDGARYAKLVVEQLTDPTRLRAARVHPLDLLKAERTYAQGRSMRGNSTWTPDRRVLDALSDAFLVSFEAVESTGARILHALDVSGSMAGASIADMPLTPREASAALALVSMSVEPDNEVVGFTGPHASGWGRGAAEVPEGAWMSSNGSRGYGWGGSRGARNSITPLSISPRQRLSDALKAVSDLPFGDTDCSLPMLWALDQKKEFDAFVVYTDNDTWSGTIHPHQALAMYNEKMGLNARLIVVAMTPTSYSIAEPGNPLMLDVVGMDTSTPKIISAFAAGQI